MANFDMEKVKTVAVKTANTVKDVSVRAANDVVWEVKAAEDRTYNFSQNDIAYNKMLTMLSYVGVLNLIPLLIPKLTGRKSKFMAFHAGQGLILMIIEIAAALVLGLLGKIPVLGVIFTIAKLLVYLACAAVSVKCLLDVYNGKAKLLPYANRLGIGKFIK